MSTAIPLDGRLDLSAAAPLLQQLRSHAQPDLVLDACSVTHLGALCLQVMLAASQAARNAGGELKLINASDRVLNQLRVMGLSPEAISAPLIEARQ